MIDKKKEIKKCCSWFKHHIWKVGTVLFLVLFLISLVTAGFGDWSSFSGLTKSQAKLDLFVMSQCPYGIQAEDQIIPIIKTLGEDVEFNIEYIVQDGGNGQFQSLHGSPEVAGNIMQLCAKSVSSDKYLDFILCQNVDSENIPSNWEGCAVKAEIDATAIQTCYTGEEGKKLLSESAAKAEALQVQGSPTIYINDKEYSGSREGFLFMKVLCEEIGSSEVCDSLPECTDDSHCVAQPEKDGICTNNTCSYVDPVEVTMYILNDKKCSDCSTNQITQYMQGWFKGLKVVAVDVSDDQGKKLINDLGIVYAPAYIFSKNIVNTRLWTTNGQIRSYFEPKGDNYILTNTAVSATWFVDETKKAEFVKSLGITLGDNKPQVDFFVMSYCPYGNQAEEAMYPVYKNLGDSVEFKPRYVFYPGYQGGGAQYCIDSASQYCSMHGIQEANQDIRELCVLKDFGISKWFDFAIAMNSKCTYSNADTCWEAVAKGLGLDTTKINDCQKNEGESLAKIELDASTKFGASGSPTVFVDGVKFGGERNANGYQTAICSAFDKAPEGCAKQLSGSSATVAASAGACGA